MLTSKYKRKRSLGLLILIAALFLSKIAYTNTEAPITMAVDPDWLPFEFLDEKGNFTGIAADLIKLIEKRSKLSFELMPTRNWHETLEKSKAGEVILLPFLSQTPKREEWLVFSKPIFKDPTVIISHVNTPKITSLENLGYRTVALPEGTSVEERLRRDFPLLKILITPTEKEALEMVSQKTADFSVRSLTSAAYTIRNENLINLRFDTEIEGYETLLRIGVLKSHAHLLPILNTAIDTITTDERDAIVNRHVTIVIEEDKDYSKIILLFFLSLFFIGILFYWNYRAHRSNRIQQGLTEKLKQSQDRFYELEKQSRSYTWEFNTDGLMTYVSPGIFHVLGYRPEDIIGKSYVADQMPPDQKIEIKALAMELLKNNQPLYNFENRQLHANGDCLGF